MDRAKSWAVYNYINLVMYPVGSFFSLHTIPCIGGVCYV